MIDVGGKNLPKSISSRLGSKLAKIYKKAGIKDVKNGVKKSLEVLTGNPEINKIDENTLEIKIEYDEAFCPIGGDPNPEKAKIIQESICIPYTYGFHNEYISGYNYEMEIKECIISSKGKICKYILNRTEINNHNNQK